MAFVVFQDVGKIYKTGEVQVEALRGATFEVEKGELCVIVGPSGAGKTTLLNILGGMDTRTSGKVFLDGAEVSDVYKRQVLLIARKAVVLTEYPVSADRHGHIDRQHLSHV